MRWTDAQRAMLQEMGIRLWPAWPGGESSAPVPEPVTARVPALVPAQVPAPEVAPPVRPLAAPPVVLPVRLTPSAEALPVSIPALPPAGSAIPLETAPAQTAWSTLRAEVAACRACGLCESRTQPVFGVGHPQAHWMLVGEAPGEQEDLQGEPFVGKSGQLLDNMLRAVGLTRSDTGAGGTPATPERQVYIANVLKCRPPANRNPQPDEVARCEPFLRRQVALVQPRLILAMGRFAVQSLLKTQEPIGRLRGRVHQYEGVPVVVTYHPAYLLRNPLDKVRSWEDLCLALEVMRGDGPEAVPPPPSLL